MLHQSKLRIPFFLLFASCSPVIVNGQDGRAATSAVWDSVVMGTPEDFAELRNTLAELDYMIEAGEFEKEENRASLPPFVRRIKFGKRRLAAIVDSEQVLRDRHQSMQAHLLGQRMEELNALRDSIKRQAEQLARDGDLAVLSKSAMERMAEKIGEAQVEHRLRELESQALIEAFKETAQKQERKVHNQSRIELAQKKYELMKERFNRAKALSKNSMVSKTEVEEAELLVLEAEAALREIIQGFEVNDKVNRQIADAATSQIVSARMNRFLQEESRRINELLLKSTDLEELESESDFVAAQIRQIRIRLSELETEAQIEDKSLYRARMLVKEAEKTLKKLEGLMGNEEPDAE